MLIHSANPPQPLAVESNFARAESYLRAAAAAGADLAVLPEYHLTAWCPSHPDFISASLLSSTYLPRYQSLARELSLNIVPGTILFPSDSPSPKDDKKLLNIAHWLSPSGAILASYTKKNLWHPERPHLAAGAGAEPHTAFDTPLTWPDGRPVRAGLLVCWDLAFPEAFRALVADGAEVVVVPAWWEMGDVDGEARRVNPECERMHLEGAMVARAWENGVVVVFVNKGGLSRVVVPVAGVVGEVKGEAVEGMEVVEVDLGVLEVAERNYKVRADMKGEGWHYGYTLWKGDGEGGGKGEGGSRG